MQELSESQTLRIGRIRWGVNRLRPAETAASAQQKPLLFVIQHRRFFAEYYANRTPYFRYSGSVHCHYDIIRLSSSWSP